MPRRLALVAVVLLAGLAPAAAAPRLDFAGTALNVLPPGQAGSLAFPPNATDQLALYDGLTPLRGEVTDRDVRRFYKSARFGPDGRAVRTVRPRAGVAIVRDRWGVPHVTGRTRPDVAFGAGWATAEDRGLLTLLRGPGRIAALDAPGLNAFALATSGRQFVSSEATERLLAAQIELLRSQGADGRAIVADMQAYVAGINAYNRRAGLDITPWTPNDVVAVAALIGAVFGSGGGDEARASAFLRALQARLGAERGRTVWNDLRQLDDPDARTAVPGRFPYATAWTSERGNALVDDASIEPWGGRSAPVQKASMSNALVVGRERSATGHPLFVAGPQTGHLYPQILMELDLHGGGVDARGAAFPGVSFTVLVGRGKDYAWSATSANSDIVDQVVEVLCGDDLHYRYQGSCRAMETFDAGVLVGRNGAPDEPVVFRTTVHGPVDGYATVGGQRVAIANQRSTRGRELLSARFFADLNLNRITSAESLRAANRMEMTFNWLYADDRDIAQFTSGRLPLRSPDVNPSLPRLGTGEFEWRGFAPFAAHARVVNPPSDTIVNWNNKAATGFAASDDDWSAGIVQRVDLLGAGLAGRPRHTLASVVSTMNLAATTDVRGALVWPTIVRALGTPPDARLARVAALVSSWQAAGSSRLDANLDGTIDDPGAAIMDAAWPRLADAVLAPVLGPLVDRLAALEGRSNQPANGNAFGSGWYGYVRKDLGALLGESLRKPYATRFCGGGALPACRASLWAALDAAATALESAQGPDPAAWRSSATAERVTYGFLPRSMRFANRPTFQQVVTFTGHRPRG